jgi:thioester reductase-like protein
MSVQILVEARLRAGVPTLNVRLGQICGGKNGFWSITDWVPIIVATSVELGCLPDAIGVSPIHV